MADARHKNGKGTANLQQGRIHIVGPGDDPVDSSTVNRSEVPAFRSRAGLAQMENVNAGDRGPERRGGKTPHHNWYHVPKPAAKKTAKKK
jgi:hypothetical protein